MITLRRLLFCLASFIIIQTIHVPVFAAPVPESNAPDNAHLPRSIIIPNAFGLLHPLVRRGVFKNRTYRQGLTQGIKNARTKFGNVINNMIPVRARKGVPEALPAIHGDSLIRVHVKDKAFKDSTSAVRDALKMNNDMMVNMHKPPGPSKTNRRPTSLRSVKSLDSIRRKKQNTPESFSI